MRRDTFLPSRDGFAFPNTFDEPASTFGLGAPLRPSFGLGAGMAWLALDRFLEGRPIPSHKEPPAATDPLHSELVLRQANALTADTWAKLIDWQCRSERRVRWRLGLTDLSRIEWRRIRRSLDASRPVLLFLVLAQGRHANPSMNKTVLAVGYEVDRRGRRASVLVYDPDRPGKDNIRLVFRTGLFDALDARLAIQTAVRGFFALPYDRPLPAGLSLLEPFGTRDHTIESIIALRARRRAEGSLDIFARERDGGLLQVQRDGRAVWSTSRLAKDSSPALQAAREDGAVAVTGRCHVLARGNAGDLLEFRRRPLLGWRVHNVTSTRRLGTAFRIDSGLAALTRRDGRVSAVASRQGAPMYFERDVLGRWRAERIAAESMRTLTLEGTAALTELGSRSLHVLSRTDAGDLVHLRRTGRSGWAADNVTIRAGGRARFAVADEPLVLRDRAEATLNVITRSPAGDLLLFRWNQRRGWRGIELSGAARAAGNELPPALSPFSAAIDREGTVHVVAREAQGGLIHVWCDRAGTAGGDEVALSRAAIGERGRIDGAPVIAAVGGGLHVFARQAQELLLFRWSALGDWTCENVTREQHASGTPAAVGDPVTFCTDGAVHLAFNGATRAYHLAAAVRSRPSSGGRQARLLAWLAQHASAALVPLQSAGLAIDRISDMVGRLFEGVRANAAGRSRAAMSGIGARFVRATPSRHTVAPARSQPLRSLAAERSSRGQGKAAASPVSAKPRPQPAIAGLPLLPEDAGDEEVRPALVVAQQVGSPVTLPPRPKPDTNRNQREMQRILALADQEAPKLIQQ